MKGDFKDGVKPWKNVQFRGLVCNLVCPLTLPFGSPSSIRCNFYYCRGLELDFFFLSDPILLLTYTNRWQCPKVQTVWKGTFIGLFSSSPLHPVPSQHQLRAPQITNIPKNVLLGQSGSRAWHWHSRTHNPKHQLCSWHHLGPGKPFPASLRGLCPKATNKTPEFLCGRGFEQLKCLGKKRNTLIN